MITLTDQQLEFLEQEIQQRGISHPGLGDQLLDHFACGIEDAMEAGLGFHEAYHKVYMQVSPNGLEEIDHSMTLVIFSYEKVCVFNGFQFRVFIRRGLHFQKHALAVGQHHDYGRCARVYVCLFADVFPVEIQCRQSGGAFQAGAQFCF